MLRNRHKQHRRAFRDGGQARRRFVGPERLFKNVRPERTACNDRQPLRKPVQQRTMNQTLSIGVVTHDFAERFHGQFLQRSVGLQRTEQQAAEPATFSRCNGVANGVFTLGRLSVCKQAADRLFLHGFCQN